MVVPLQNMNNDPSVPPAFDKYPGDLKVDDPQPEGGYKLPDEVLKFPDPFLLLCFFDPDISDGQVTAHPWQMEELEFLGKAKATSQHPQKYCLIGSNGSGKDKFIIAPFAVWFILTKIRSRVIITTASGTQLSSQTEPYVKDLCQKINAYFGWEVFRIRQRFIRCILTGSEIRMFATDEAGKAEGYHPLDANSEMAIIVNEGKSVTEDIHRALRRCTGYNYWLEISSAGEPTGFFYHAAKSWSKVRYITSYDCPHINPEEIKEDIDLDGETSAYFRSKHLSAFTSLGGQVVISLEVVDYCLTNPPQYLYTSSKWEDRIGVDLAAGGAETSICRTKGNKCLAQHHFREKDTVVAAKRINDIFLNDLKITKQHKHIYADDGGVGRGIIDNLVHMGWTINRVMNQWPALSNTKQFGNRGAENWHRCKRIIEEHFFDLTTLDKKTLDQLCVRHYRQTATSGKIYLEDKKTEIAHGHPSPDRADAFILSLTGLTIMDFINDQPTEINARKKEKESKEPRFSTNDQIIQHYEDSVTYTLFDEKEKRRRNHDNNVKFPCLKQLLKN